MKKLILIFILLLITLSAIIYSQYPYWKLNATCKNEYCRCVAKYASSKLKREEIEFFTQMIKNNTAGDYLQVNALSYDPIVETLRKSYFICK